MAPIVLVTGALDANSAVCQMAMLGLLGLVWKGRKASIDRLTAPKAV